MFEQDLGLTLIVLIVGIILGVIATMLSNKLRSGSASPTKIKREMEDYQNKVDAHFAETSKKFKEMTNQYQDLYQHLAEGATTLCRPDNIAATMIEDSSVLKRKSAIEQKPKQTSDKKESSAVKEPPVKEPPVKEPPVKEPPVKEPPVKEPPVKEPTANTNSAELKANKSANVGNKAPANKNLNQKKSNTTKSTTKV